MFDSTELSAASSLLRVEDVIITDNSRLLSVIALVAIIVITGIMAFRIGDAKR